MRHKLPLGASLFTLSLVAALPAHAGIVSISLDPSAPSGSYIDSLRTQWTNTDPPVLIKASVVVPVQSTATTTVVLDTTMDTVDPPQPWSYDIQNDSNVAWVGVKIGIGNGFVFDQTVDPAVAVAVDPNTWITGATVFPTQSEATPTEITFTGGTLAPGQWLEIDFDADQPLDPGAQITNTLTPIVVPEPASLSLLGLAALGLLGVRRKNA